VSYAPPPEQDAAEWCVARFARGRDYHKVLKRRCHALTDRIRAVAPSFSGRAFVDSGPVMERTLAAQAGVGWIGRNACLIVPGLGSYVVLCEIVCNLPLACDVPLPSGCQDCGRCVKACPAGALTADGLVDARRCISYLTIEDRAGVDRDLWPLTGGRVFGCDACQECCPHNRRLPPGDPELTAIRSAIFAGRCGLGGQIGEILAWTRAEWDRRTRGSALRRVGYDRLLRNAVRAAGNLLRRAPRERGDAKGLVGALREIRGAWPPLEALIAWAMEGSR
jgi:epoxyqueuosine reductase